MKATIKDLKISLMAMFVLLALALFAGCTNKQTLTGPQFSMECAYQITSWVNVITGTDTTFVALDSVLRCQGGRSGG